MKDAGSGQDDRANNAQTDRLIEDLREAIRARDEFVAIAAHELRNPMTPILMQVGRLLSAARDPDRCRPEVIIPRLEALEHAVEEFVRRSTVLLDISRIAAGNVRIELAETDLTSVVRGVVDSAAIAARLARTRLEADLQDGVIGLLDGLALEQVVQNLISNAIKFGAAHPVTVTLRSDGRTASLSVRDRGIGIREEDRQRIFERFERAIARSEHGGFGVGLWLANRLVTAMGGTIAVESVPGKGSVFTVRLPLGGAEQHGASGK